MSNLRLSGLASGMDTDSMIQSLMKVERLKVDRYEQSKQIALWRQEAYNSMNKTFANFILNTRKDMGLTKVTSTGLALGNSYTNLDYIRKAISSNETAATVSSTSKAVNGSFNLDIKSVAKAATLTSAEITNDDLKGLASLRTETAEGIEKYYKEIRFNINGDEIVVSKEVQSVDEEVNFTIDDIVKVINNNKGKSETTAFYDKNTKRLFIQGYASEDMVKGLANDKNEFALTINGIGAGGEGLVSLLKSGTVGEDYFVGDGTIAEVKVNGLSIRQASNIVKFNALNIELKAQGTTTIKVDTNIDGIMEKVEKLINDYNELVDKASKTLSEKRYPSYHPLSQEEKKAMHENDAKLWEEKAKSGMLNRDETIQRVLQNARNDLYREVGGVTGSFKHITEIGITTEKYSRGTTGGKLQIDKEKLREAIEKDPEGVMELLFKEPSKLERDTAKYPNTDQGNRDYEAAERANRRDNGGIFTRVYDNLIDGLKSIIDKSGPGEDSDLFRSVRSNILLDFVTKKSSISDLDKEVLDANKRIDDLNAMLYRKENAYYAKFANMEKMLSQMNSQSSWLAQQFMR